MLKKKVLTDDEIIENVWNQLHAGKSLKDLTEFEQEIFASVERNK